MAGPPIEANNRKTVTVMIRNLCVGADLLPASAAIAGGDPIEICRPPISHPERISARRYPVHFEIP